MNYVEHIIMLHATDKGLHKQYPNRFIRWKELVAITYDGCWLWLGSVGSNGYGNFEFPEVGMRGSCAHRAGYVLLIGYYEGEIMKHSCRRRRCVNPLHVMGSSYLINNLEALEVRNENRANRRNSPIRT